MITSNSLPAELKCNQDLYLLLPWFPFCKQAILNILSSSFFHLFYIYFTFARIEILTEMLRKRCGKFLPKFVTN